MAAVLVVALAPASLAPPAHADGFERVLNGTFAAGKAPWWSSGNTPSQVDAAGSAPMSPAGTVNPWDSMIGQNDIPLEAGQPYTLRFTASATSNVTVRAALALAVKPNTSMFTKAVTIGTTAKTFVLSDVATIATLSGQLGFQLGANGGAVTFCVDDVSLTGGAIPPGGGHDYGSPVRVNQLGYLPSGPKQASIVDNARPTPVRGSSRIPTAGPSPPVDTKVQGDDASPATTSHRRLLDVPPQRPWLHPGRRLLGSANRSTSRRTCTTRCAGIRWSTSTTHRSGTPIDADLRRRGLCPARRPHRRRPEQGRHARAMPAGHLRLQPRCGRRLVRRRRPGQVRRQRRPGGVAADGSMDERLVRAARATGCWRFPRTTTGSRTCSTNPGGRWSSC